MTKYTPADYLLYVNLAWYVLLAVSFAGAGQYPKAIYFFGAAVLTVGVVMM